MPYGVAHYLLAIMNALNVPSRVLPGLLADRYGTLPVFVPVAAACGVLLLGLWLPATSTGAIVAFAALYGLFSGGCRAPPRPAVPCLADGSPPGAFVSLVPTYFASISPRDKFGARVGASSPPLPLPPLCLP